jgi:hypothetical protein
LWPWDWSVDEGTQESNLELGVCLSPFSVAIKNYLKPGHLSKNEKLLGFKYISKYKKKKE